MVMRALDARISGIAPGRTSKDPRVKPEEDREPKSRDFLTFQ